MVCIVTVLVVSSLFSLYLLQIPIIREEITLAPYKREIREESSYYVYSSPIYGRDGRKVASIYILAPERAPTYRRFLVSISHPERTKIRSLSVEVRPLNPLQPLRWTYEATSISIPIRFHELGWGFLWKCEDFEFYGESTVTLKFYVMCLSSDSRIDGFLVKLELTLLEGGFPLSKEYLIRGTVSLG